LYFRDIFPCVLSQLAVLQKDHLERDSSLVCVRMTAFVAVLESVVSLAAQSDQRKFGSSVRYVFRFRFSSFVDIYYMLSENLHMHHGSFI
jgi:hypothetical protein